jgi:acyl-CoA thioesterase-1
MPNKSPDYARPAPGISPSRHGTSGGDDSDGGGGGAARGELAEWTMQTERDLLHLSRSKEASQNCAGSDGGGVGLPRVLLIGDSISIGYTDAVRQQLAGVADVYRPDINCGHTGFGLENIGTWLQQAATTGAAAGVEGHTPRFDCVHFNFGIHDIKCPNRDGQNNTPLHDYRANLAEIIRVIRAAGVRHVIWCSTTLSVEEVCGAPSEDFVRYNQAAREVVAAANADAAAAATAEAGAGAIQINDLYSFSLPRLADLQIPRNSHFTPRGSAVLGGQVAAATRAALFS